MDMLESSQAYSSLASACDLLREGLDTQPATADLSTHHAILADWEDELQAMRDQIASTVSSRAYMWRWADGQAHGIDHVAALDLFSNYGGSIGELELIIPAGSPLPLPESAHLLGEPTDAVVAAASAAWRVARLSYNNKAALSDKRNRHLLETSVMQLRRLVNADRLSDRLGVLRWAEVLCRSLHRLAGRLAARLRRRCDATDGTSDAQMVERALKRLRRTLRRARLFVSALAQHGPPPPTRASPGPPVLDWLAPSFPHGPPVASGHPDAALGASGFLSVRRPVAA